MAGNSPRRGATRRTPKKGPSAGSGGKRRRGLAGKGPTPKAEDRVYHPAHQRKVAREKATSRRGQRAPKRGSTEYVAGRNSAVEALRAQVPVTALYIAARIDTDDRVREILSTVTRAGQPVLEVGKAELDRLTDGAVHQGIALQVPPYVYRHPQDLLTAASGTPLIVALDGVTDPRNLGAILRSAGAFGADGVLVPERRSAGVTAAAWKVSAGAAARVPVARATNLVRALTEYQEAGCFVVGLSAEATITIGELELADSPLVLVIGSEGKGLSRLVRDTCDLQVAIPITAATESLNASVAAGIALYEIARRR
jgi:23S rRNA (guanosine2251-2'-O)-methyltransferase